MAFKPRFPALPRAAVAWSIHGWRVQREGELLHLGWRFLQGKAWPQRQLDGAALMRSRQGVVYTVNSPNDSSSRAHKGKIVFAFVLLASASAIALYFVIGPSKTLPEAVAQATTSSAAPNDCTSDAYLAKQAQTFISNPDESAIRQFGNSLELGGLSRMHFKSTCDARELSFDADFVLLKNLWTLNKITRPVFPSG